MIMAQVAGSGTIAMPSAYNPEISEGFTVVPEVVYTPIVLLPGLIRTDAYARGDAVRDPDRALGR